MKSCSTAISSTGTGSLEEAGLPLQRGARALAPTWRWTGTPPLVPDPGVHKYVPTQLVYFAPRPRRATKPFTLLGCSNGNASGNTPAEAVLQGFFELVERDATALWWYNRLPRPGVDLSTFGEPYLLELAEHYRTVTGREAWPWILPAIWGFPLCRGVAPAGGAEEQIFFGLGCHLDARIALQRSFAEMNQMLSIAGYVGQDGKQPLEDQQDADLAARGTAWPTALHGARPGAAAAALYRSPETAQRRFPFRILLIAANY